MTPPTDSFDRALRDTFVRPFYLQLLRANFTRANEAEAGSFRKAILTAASTISNEQITRLLIEREWRGRLSAAWFVGLKNRGNFIPSIRKLLLASEMVYAGQGYCVALGIVGGEECRGILRDYLRSYLPLNGRVYNQDWAIGALAHLEGVAPSEFIRRELWCDGDYFMDPHAGIESFSSMILYLRRHHMIDAAS
jgi:Family of unknown function (DUF6000)